MRKMAALLLTGLLVWPLCARAQVPELYPAVLVNKLVTGLESQLADRDQNIRDQLALTVDSSVQVTLVPHHSRIHFGDDATVTVRIQSSFPRPIRIGKDEISLRPADDLGLSGSPMTCDRAIIGQGDVWVSGGSGTEVEFNCSHSRPARLYGVFRFFDYLMFRPSDTHRFGFWANLRFTPVAGPAKKGGENKRAEELERPIMRSLPVTVDMPPGVISVVAGLGCALGVCVHWLMRHALLFLPSRHERKWSFEPDPAKTDALYVLLFGVSSILLTMVIAPVTNLSLRASSVLSVHVIDAWGALALGLILHFVVYDPAYNKVLTFIRGHSN